MIFTEIEKGTRQIYKNDKKLARIIDIVGSCNISEKRNYYHALLKAIIGQQLSVKAAHVICSRFFENFNQKPYPEDILSVPDNILRNLGLSNAKTKYVKDLSLKIINNEVKFSGIRKNPIMKLLNSLLKLKALVIGQFTFS